MNIELLRQALVAVVRPEVWLGGILWGALLLMSVNFLAAGYHGPPSAFDAVLSFVIFAGIGLFLVLVGPGMVLRDAPVVSAGLWLDDRTAHLNPSRAWLAFAIGMGFALLARNVPPTSLIRSRLFACLTQALATLATIAYFTTGGNHFMPSPFLLAGLGVAGVLIVGITQALLESALPDVAARAWIFLGPIIIAVAVAPYAGWVRTFGS